MYSEFRLCLLLARLCLLEPPPLTFVLDGYCVSQTLLRALNLSSAQLREWASADNLFSAHLRELASADNLFSTHLRERASADNLFSAHLRELASADNLSSAQLREQACARFHSDAKSASRLSLGEFITSPCVATQRAGGWVF